MSATLGEGSVLGRYELGALLGKGAMAQVFRATDRELSRPVALKVLNQALSRTPEHRQRFLREARVMAALSHENLARVYDTGEEDQWAWMAMELIEGESLDARLLRQPQPSLGWVMDTMRGILAALDYVHAREIVHRDIKPQNILLGADDQVKLVDFGLVKVQDQLNVTRVGIRLGTPRYMSPEAAVGEAVTYQSDLFSAAMVLHELLTGRLPMEEIRDQASYDRLKNGITPPPSRFRPGLPEELDKIVIKALAFRSWDRFDSARKFSDALAKVKLPAHDPAAVSAESPVQKARGGRTVIQSASKPGEANTVIEAFDKVKTEKSKDPNRKSHRKKHKKRKRRWPLALALLISGVGLGMVALVLYLFDRFNPKQPDPVPTAVVSAPPSASASPVPRPSPGQASDPHQELASARAAWAELSRVPAKSTTSEGLNQALTGQKHLEQVLKTLGSQSLLDGLGPDGRHDFFNLLERFDESITRVRDPESLFKGMMVEEAVLGSAIDVRQRMAGRNARLVMLDRISVSEAADPAFWELASRCAFRVGMMVPAVLARYRWQQCLAEERLSKGQPQVVVSELKLLARADQVMLTINLPRSAGVNPISGARSPWTAAWDRLGAGMSGAAVPAASAAPATAVVPGTPASRAPSPSPGKPAPSASASARPLVTTLDDSEESRELDNMEDDILSSRPRAAPSALVARTAIRPRAHRMAAPAFDQVQKLVAAVGKLPPDRAASDGALIKTLTGVIEQLNRLRACARVDEAAIEFYEPGQPNLYDALRQLHTILGTVPRIDGNLRNQLLEYTDQLRQLGDGPMEDAAYSTIFGQAALLCGHVGVAEDAFLKALAAPLGHPEGRGPAEALTGPALSGLARAVWTRCEIAGDPGIHKPGLLDNSLIDLDLFRLHVLAGSLAGVAPQVALNWQLAPAESAQIVAWATKARELLARRGLIQKR